jgi:hypothetical protein
MAKADQSKRGPGRPTNEVETIRVHIQLSLRPGRDDDLITFFAALPRGYRASAVMAAMRSGDLNATTDPDYVADDEMTDALMDLML